jgi:nicotinamidase-related amidase
MAANLGFNVWLVEDGTATFDRTSFDGEYYSAEQMHAINLASLNGEFCTVLKTADVLSQFT